MWLKMFYCVLLVTMFLEPGDTFIMHNAQCPVEPPCGCSGGDLVCGAMGLTILPNIYPVQTFADIISMNFSENRLVEIPSNAFKNITADSGTHIFIFFNRNQISTISDHAFTGVEHVIRRLYISNNNLSSIPSAVGHLTFLEVLYIDENPILTIDGRVFAGIRGYLTHLAISFRNMLIWPRELHLLVHLQSLYISHIPFRSIPTDAFNGFQTTLKTLTLLDTVLEQIPENICKLIKIEYFSFSDNRVLRANTSLDYLCHEPLPHVTSVVLAQNDFYSFPSGLFTKFPQLSLNLANNKLRYITYEDIPSNTHLRYMVLQGNLFINIPYAINKLLSLQTLTMSYNQISFIEHNTLVDLQHLAALDMSYNPLEYIDPAAFRKQNSTLHRLDLSYTHLDRIPLAVTTLNILTNLNFEMKQDTECTCE